MTDSAERGLRVIAFDQGHHQMARSLYEMATKVMPERASAWYNLANALDELEKIDAAARAFTRALDLDPEYADAHFNLALLWEKNGTRDRARVHWQAFLSLAPDHPSAQTAHAFLEA